MTHRTNTTARNPGAALTIAENAFRCLVTGPRPLALDGLSVGHGLPGRMVDLAELRGLLLDRQVTQEMKDAAWAELVRLARTGDPAWVVGCVGVAIPGLKAIAGRAIRHNDARFAEDIVSEILTEFVAQLQRIDLARPAIAARLLVWADRKAPARARAGALRQCPTDPTELTAATAAPSGDPSDVLREGVRLQVITADEAAIIQATRLDGVPLPEFAHTQGEPRTRVAKRRERAEARLVAAIRSGQVSAISGDWLSRSAP
ncbi:hypothetical protein J4573_45245 [Actinomadura barringtoniae]|uniref:Sigma-70 family RNA polymerase sigma factor n=1 Tax=Actinomadura barringtoniae TaxID=1427535 RepID=A0A939TFH0_9ACTN|nr:hypothetical protein [Actinomadura barringtoniae]MBO2454360.1 hypothetical protein [Actinomadura barringtoniae]